MHHGAILQSLQLFLLSIPRRKTRDDVAIHLASIFRGVKHGEILNKNPRIIHRLQIASFNRAELIIKTDPIARVRNTRWYFCLRCHSPCPDPQIASRIEAERPLIFRPDFFYPLGRSRYTLVRRIELSDESGRIERGYATHTAR